MEATDTDNPNLNYGLVVDCGSSGSRVFVYTWPRHNGNLHELLDIKQMRDKHRKPVVMKIKPGMGINDYAFTFKCIPMIFFTHVSGEKSTDSDIVRSVSGLWTQFSE